MRWWRRFRPVRWLGGALVAFLAIGAWFTRKMSKAAQDAKNEVKHEYEQETARRVLAGDKAVRRSGDGSPDKRVSRNDAGWSE